MADLVDLPEGQPGRPSRAMTEQQAATVLTAATGTPIGYVTVVKIGNYRQAATHAATEAGQLAWEPTPARTPPSSTSAPTSPTQPATTAGTNSASTAPRQATAG